MAGRGRKLPLRGPRTGGRLRADENPARPGLRHRAVGHHDPGRPSRRGTLSFPGERATVISATITRHSQDGPKERTMSTDTAADSTAPHTSLGPFSSPGASPTPWEA